MWVIFKRQFVDYGPYPFLTVLMYLYITGKIRSVPWHFILYWFCSSLWLYVQIGHQIDYVWCQNLLLAMLVQPVASMSRSLIPSYLFIRFSVSKCISFDMEINNGFCWSTWCSLNYNVALKVHQAKILYLVHWLFYFQRSTYMSSVCRMSVFIGASSNHISVYELDKVFHARSYYYVLERLLFLASQYFLTVFYFYSYLLY